MCYTKNHCITTNEHRPELVCSMWYYAMLDISANRTLAYIIIIVFRSVFFSFCIECIWLSNVMWKLVLTSIFVNHPAHSPCWLAVELLFITNFLWIIVWDFIDFFITNFQILTHGICKVNYFRGFPNFVNNMYLFNWQNFAWINLLRFPL